MFDFRGVVDLIFLIFQIYTEQFDKTLSVQAGHLSAVVAGKAERIWIGDGQVVFLEDGHVLFLMSLYRYGINGLLVWLIGQWVGLISLCIGQVGLVRPICRIGLAGGRLWGIIRIFPDIRVLRSNLSTRSTLINQISRIGVIDWIRLIGLIGLIIIDCGVDGEDGLRPGGGEGARAANQ